MINIVGMSPSGKAPGSGPGIRGFESLHPSQEDKHTISDQLVFFFYFFENLRQALPNFYQ